MTMQHHDIRPISRQALRTGTQAVNRAVKATPKDLIYTVLLAGVTISVVTASSWFVGGNLHRINEHDQEILAQLAQRDVLVSEVRGEGADAVVVYAYKGEPIEGLLTTQEVLALRTQSSFTESIGKDETGKGIYTTVSFSRPSYVREGDGWRYIEYDEAPKRLFDRAKQPGVLGWRLLPTAIAADTIYAGSGDGVVATLLQATWNDAYAATTGTETNGSTEVSTNAAVSTGKVGGSSITRAFLPFNTSTIPAGATITAASLAVYATSTPTTPGDAFSYVTVVRTSQATHTTLVAADYDNIGSTEGISSGDRKTISTITSGNYVTFPLNSTGISWIAKSGAASNCSATAGITCIGLRDGHDIQNSAPASDVNPSYAVFSSSESTGTSQDPYLSVTYTAAFAFWQFDIF
jgi:hypothetical protein